MPLTLRPGSIADSYTVFKIFEQSIMDLGRRLGVMTISGGQDPAVLEELWQRRRSLFEHLARTAEHFWIAENEGRAVGYARTILRDGLRELTEFFVLPGQQSAGAGRELLARAFPQAGASQRAIIATLDTRAQARYLKAGVYPHFPSTYLSRSPEPVSIPSDLTFEPIAVSPANLDILGMVDMALLGHRREVDHIWLLENRQGYLYRREGQPVGYGYLGQSSGPFALWHEADFPAVLAHAETEAAGRGIDFGVEVPLINRTAVGYLLSRGCRMDQFMALFMADRPFGKFENYIFPSPPFFL
jgi:GNAT superfamily N-acetyltransferase